jgi:hypothetical protein
MLPLALKLKVVQQYEAGRLQKDIAHDLGISTGSVSMILKASKDKKSDSIPQEQPSVVANDLQIISQPQDDPINGEQSPNDGPSMDVSMTRTHFLMTHSASPVIRLAVTSPYVVAPRDGCPLSYFLDEDKSTDESSAIPTFFVKDPETEMQVNIESDANVRSAAPEEEEFEQSQPPLPTLENPSVDDWNPDENWRTRFFRTIMDEKEQRKQERILINKDKELIAYERRNLELEKKQLDYERRDIETRLQEIDKYRDLLPSAKQLREMGVDFYDIVIWIELIKDKSAMEGITPKQAVSIIVQDLKSYNQFNSLEKAIQKRQQDLAALDIAVECRQQAYRSLVDLKSKGLSDTDLVELNDLIHSQNNGFGANLRLDDHLNLPPHH